MRYSLRERHSYGNGFRKARAIGIRKLRHQGYAHLKWANHGHIGKYHKRFADQPDGYRYNYGSRGNWAHAK